MARWLAIAISAICIASPVYAQSVQRDGYVRRDTGTYVPRSYATRPDASRLNNYSTQGNVNPYSGRVGTQSPYPTYNYGTSRSRSSGSYRR